MRQAASNMSFESMGSEQKAEARGHISLQGKHLSLRIQNCEEEKEDSHNLSVASTQFGNQKSLRKNTTLKLQGNKQIKLEAQINPVKKPNIASVCTPSPSVAAQGSLLEELKPGPQGTKKMTTNNNFEPANTGEYVLNSQRDSVIIGQS